MRRPMTVVVVLALMAGACGGGGAAPQPEAVPRAEVQDLRVAVGEDPFLRGSPPTPNLGLLVDGPQPGIFETLTRLTPAFGLTAGLATRWQAETPSRWRFELRRDVRFHDGTPFTSAAVVEALRNVAAGLADFEIENVARRQSLPRGLTTESASADG
jgi:peptide/nickel transport system substrate-binding protein